MKLIFLCFVSVLLPLTASQSQQLLPDHITLLQLNSELRVPGWGLVTSNTTSTTHDFCSWPGIACYRNKSMVATLDLSRQDLTGNATLISHLTGLTRLDLSYNSFHGPIPSSFADLSTLQFLDLSYNRFGGSLPSQLGRLHNLLSLNLSNNFLTGQLPDQLGGLHMLQDLQLSSNMLNGSIPSWVANLTSLRVFAAYENHLTGSIPDTLGLNSELQSLNLHSNHLIGPIPRGIFTSGRLEILVLTQNNFTGNVPDAIASCAGLSNIRIGYNQLEGVIPKAIANLSSLTYFELDNNYLSGEIVTEFAQCSNLTLLNLASNRFTGTVPPELGQLAYLQELILSGNSLHGEIPHAISQCRNLNKLDLSNNRLNGTIPQDICKMPRLQYLILGQNSIGGEIPHQIGNCTKLLDLQLCCNHLTGSIPPEMGHLKNLQIAMNLSYNHLHGPLPVELGRLDKLVSLDVSANQLTGAIPNALRGMMSLIEVNFSHNSFTGIIPAFVPFQKSPASSFLGNKGLCGEPLSSSCSGTDDFNSNNTHRISYKIILAVVGSVLTVFISVTTVVLLFMMRERQEKVAKAAGVTAEVINKQPLITVGNVFIENLRQAIDFDAVVIATLKDSNKLSSGTFSIVYKAVMPSGIILSVKSLRSMDRTIIHHQNKMVRELERLSRLCHENLMRLIGFVIYEDVALLLHHFMPNGTLAKFLHDPFVTSDCKSDWLTRFSIAAGVAEGLAFLHHLAIIHLDISSGNIHLDANHKPLIGEVEISKLLDPCRGTASISAVAGSFGYIPPEYAYTMQVTAPGNVYSYGVVLLEILTSRLPVDEAFGEGVDLVKWVHSGLIRGETPEQILDAELSTVSFAWRKEMLGALKVALLCTDRTPAKRPKMKKVVEMLKEIVLNR
uniref:Protein kinase domain-containing protein n=1 Tax=Kalanchoe fedtschenkoi TaxID=63787 RepID=A0A7N0ZTK3_KALFE